MASLAPIALFAFNRPEHTRATLGALINNDLASDSELTIFCDGPRSEEDVDAVSEVRALVRKINGFKRIEVIERPENLGLARSVITGVTSMLEASENVIVVEDDLVTSRHFLRFMND